MLDALPIPFGNSKCSSDKSAWSVENRRIAIKAKALENKCQRLRFKILALRENKIAPSFQLFQIDLSQKQYITRIERLSSYCLSLKKALCCMEGNNSYGRQKIQRANNTCKRLIEGYEREFDDLIQAQSKDKLKLDLEERELMQSISTKFKTC